MNNATLRQTLEQIFREYGTSVLNDGERLVALFSDFAPMLKKEKILLKNVAGAGLLAPLMAAQNESAAEQKRVCEVLCERMHEDLFIDEDAARSFAGDIAAALGWTGANMPQSTPASTPVSAPHSNIPASAPSPAPVLSVQYTPGVEDEKIDQSQTLQEGDWRYVLRGESVIIVKYKGDAEVVFVPPVIAGRTVDIIGRDAFFCNKKIKKAILPPTIRKIGMHAFCACDNLESISFPEGLAVIGESAFLNSEKLEQIVLPASLEYLGDAAFVSCNLMSISVAGGSRHFVAHDNVLYSYDMTKLIICAKSKSGSFAIASTVQEICPHALRDCKMLTQVIIPQSVQTIGQFALSGCKSLGKLTVPASVREIGNGAFAYCDSLMRIDAESGFYMSIDGVLYDSRTAYIVCCPAGREGAYEVLPGFPGVGDGAFQGCRKLASVRLNHGLSYIGDAAFAGCESLENISIPSTVTTLGRHAFSCSGLQSVNICGNIEKISEAAFIFCKKLKTVHIEHGVQSIEENAFQGCEFLEAINFPDSLTAIGEGAFWFCERLAAVTIPGSVRDIGYRAFDDCKSLHYLAIGEGVQNIGSYAFSDCKSLHDVTIPHSVKSIGNGAFLCCDRGLTIYAPHEASYYGYDIGYSITWIVR